jgi:hypothetical protein
VKVVVPLAFAFLAIFWLPALGTGYLMEDSWFLFHRKLSLADLAGWFIESRDSFGYYRPVRRVFFAIPNLFYREPPPLLYHGISFLFFTGTVALAFGIYKSLLSDKRLAWAAAAAFGVAACFAKPMFWLAASHNIFAAFFCASALLLRLKGYRAGSALAFLLALGSRETSFGLLLPLLWIDFQRAGRWRLSESWELLLAGGAGAALLLGGRLPPYLPERGGFWLWPLQWLKYIAVLLVPGFKQGGAALLAAGAFTAFLLPVLIRQLWRREVGALFGLTLVGGLLVHLCFPLPWNEEYAGIAALGFFGFAFQQVGKLRIYRLPVAAMVLVLFLSVGWIAREQASSYYGGLSDLGARWVQAFGTLESGLAPEEVVVIRAAASFSEDHEKPMLAFLPPYLRLRFPGRIVLWDLQGVPGAEGAFGLSIRALRQAEPQLRLQGAVLVHVR